MDSTIACLRVVLHRVGGPPLYRTPDIWYFGKGRDGAALATVRPAAVGGEDGVIGRRLVDS